MTQEVIAPMSDQGYRRVPLLRGGEVVAYAMVDLEDAAAVHAAGPWRLSSAGYAYRYEGRGDSRQTLLMHRELLGLDVGDRRQADHVNRNRLDNRRTNLRIASHAENGQNQASRRGSRSRFRNVYWDRRKERWFAQAKVDGRQRYIGMFASEIDAARAAESFRRDHMPFAQPDPELIAIERN